MSKLLSLLIATIFATASVGAFATTAAKDPAKPKTEEKKVDCSKTEKMDDKTKAECSKKK
jgi:hypothetical protein